MIVLFFFNSDNPSGKFKLESFIVSGAGSDLTVLIRILRREYIIFTLPLPQHTGIGLEAHRGKKMVSPSPENLFPSDLNQIM